MLQLYSISHIKLDGLIDYKELKVEHEINTESVLSFSYPISDAKNDLIQEECYIRTKDNEYIVKEVNYKDDDWTEYICKINIEGIKGKDVSHFETVEQSCTNSVNLALVGTGWTIGSCNVTKLRTVRKNNCNAYTVLQEIQSAYGCEMTFDSINKKVYIYKSLGTDKGTYFAEQLNLKKLDVQRNSYDYITRLIPLGKDGLDIASVNGGLNYVQNNQYSNKVITAYWEDNRYTDAQSLLEDATARLDYLSKPYKSYKADVIDLASINPVQIDARNLVTNGNFVNGTTGWNLAGGCSISVVSNELTDINTGSNNAVYQNISTGTITGHKYYCTARVKSGNSLVMLRLSALIVATHSGSDQYEKLSGIAVADVTNHNINITNNTIGAVAKVQQVLVIDLTTTFGAGNEPTQAWCDANIIWTPSPEEANYNQYSILDYLLGDTITLLAKSKNTKEKQRIIKLTQYPDEPERNTCEIANKLLNLANLQVRFVDTADVVDTITTVGGLVDGTKVDSIDWSQLQNVHIVIADIQDLSVVTARIGTLETTTAHITNGIIDNATIDVAKVNNLSATYATIINLTAANANIISLIADKANITDLNVVDAKIINLVVNTAQIGNAQITTAKIALGAITTALIDVAAIGTTQIADASITDAKVVDLSANSITAGTLSVDRLIIRGATTSLVYAINNISGALQSQNVDTLNGEILTPRTILADRIVAKAITAAEIASKTITANEIKALTITSAEIKAGTITATQIAAGTITTNELASTVGAGLNISSNTSITLKADKTYVDAVRARNLVANGNFANGTTGWTAELSTGSVTDGVYSCTGNGTDLPYPLVSQNTTTSVTVGHIINVKALVRVTNAVCRNIYIVLDGTTGGTNQTYILVTPTLNQWYPISVNFTVPADFTGNYRVYFQHEYADNATANGKVMEIQEVFAISLTDTFGVGSEPTQTWCDANIPWSPAPEDSPTNANIISAINISPEAIGISASKVNISGTVTLSSWSNATDVTKIDGGKIYAGSITADKINVTDLIAMTLTNDATDPECWSTVGTMTVDGVSCYGIFIYRRGFSTTVPVCRLLSYGTDGSFALVDDAGVPRFTVLHDYGTFIADRYGHVRMDILDAGGTNLYRDNTSGTYEDVRCASLTLTRGDVQTQLDGKGVRIADITLSADTYQVDITIPAGFKRINVWVLGRAVYSSNYSLTVDLNTFGTYASVGSLGGTADLAPILNIISISNPVGDRKTIMSHYSDGASPSSIAVDVALTAEINKISFKCGIYGTYPIKAGSTFVVEGWK